MRYTQTYTLQKQRNYVQNEHYTHNTHHTTTATTLILYINILCNVYKVVRDAVGYRILALSSTPLILSFAPIKKRNPHESSLS